MTKTANKLNSLDRIAFVEDIDQEAAASYSGGIGRINDGKNDPDVILYENTRFGGASIGINAATGDGVPYVGNSFNDKTTSIRIIRGRWRFHTDANYGGDPLVLLPGTYDVAGGYNSFPFRYLGPNFNDKFSSLFREV